MLLNSDMAFFSMKKAQAQQQRKTIWDTLYKQRSAISAFLSVIVLVAGGWFLIYPRWQVLQQMRQLTAEQIAKNAELQGLVTRLQAFEKNYSQAKELAGQSSIADVAGSSLDFARMLAEIVAVSKQSNVPLLGVSMDDGSSQSKTSKPKGAVEEKPLPKGVKAVDISITLKSDGDYAVYKSFLTALEQALPLYDVQAFAIEAADSGSQSGGSGKKGTEITARTYYYDTSKKDQPKASATTVSVTPQE